MKKFLCAALILLSLSFCSQASDRGTDIFQGVISTGIATWGYVEIAKTPAGSGPRVFVDFIAIFFTVKAVIHFAKAAVE
jgi:hypothetical protein